MEKNTSHKSRIPVRVITMTALLSAIAFLLAFPEFPVPLSPAGGLCFCVSLIH